MAYARIDRSQPDSSIIYADDVHDVRQAIVQDLRNTAQIHLQNCANARTKTFHNQQYRIYETLVKLADIYEKAAIRPV